VKKQTKGSIKGGFRKTGEVKERGGVKAGGGEKKKLARTIDGEGVGEGWRHYADRERGQWLNYVYG
jgi:hypothetical protein